MFNDVYQGKTVLITGNTGFKGSWLTTWLSRLGANIVGVSKDVPTSPSMYEVLKLENKIKHFMVDVRNLDALKEIIAEEKPDFIFHLAAQAIVSESYKSPVETITSNVVGTMNILEALRATNRKCCAVLITSDKSYDNVEWVWGYKETDHLGGKDVYSGSKGAAELVIKSYVNSFFSNNDHPVRIAVARAGNVIGGGDWAKDRIVVDCVKAWNKGASVDIRSSQATRPWQHVLEPISGYLALGSALFSSERFHGEAFNFGPRSDQDITVLKLLHDLASEMGYAAPEKAYQVTDEVPFNESGLLKLNCDKALHYLKWQSTLTYNQTVGYVGDWYSSFYMKDHRDMLDKTYDQISSYEDLAADLQSEWTK